jgi:hypothetical protein
MDQPMSGHADSYQALLFQEVDHVGQGCYKRELKWSRLFTPSPLELRDSANEGREARLMIFTIKPCPMPSPQRSFMGEVKEASAWASLKTYAPDNLTVNGTRLMFEKKVVFEQREIRRNP